MRTFCTFFIAFLWIGSLFGQSRGLVADTLLRHTFEGLLDPSDTMLNQPTGDDIHWVNYDQDKKKGICVQNAATPGAWYWESDLGSENPSTATNFAFTSCSFFDPNIVAIPQARNWLITSPVFIPDDGYQLSWRSLSYYGPQYMDGYRVLVSTSSNLPAAFTDTLFSAAQTVTAFVTASLDLNDYIFSSGYIHADGYTNGEYFFVDLQEGDPFYHGKLEPHDVSLAEYAGQTIYIAFLHDSYNDFQVQVDDILVTNTKVATASPLEMLYFNISPNPVEGTAFASWKTQMPQSGYLTVTDQKGRQVFRQYFGAQAEGRVKLDLNGLPAGNYYCQLQTAHGQVTKMLVKL